MLSLRVGLELISVIGKALVLLNLFSMSSGTVIRYPFNTPLLQFVFLIISLLCIMRNLLPARSQNLLRLVQLSSASLHPWLLIPNWFLFNPTGRKGLS